MNKNARHIVGALTQTNSEAVNPHTRFNTYTALMKAGIYGTFSAAGWESGSLVIDHVSTVDEGEDSGLDFIQRLKTALMQEGVRELKLDGQMTVTQTGVTPHIYHVVVEHGVLRYQLAELSFKAVA